MALVINGLLFVAYAANPLLVSDGWYYLDVFLRKGIEHDLALRDFFVRRAGVDHSQPLLKLIYLVELWFFELDFVPQAILGFACAIGIAYVIKRNLNKDIKEDGNGWIAWLGFAAVLTPLLSLNSGAVWTWPDVSVQYVIFLVVAVFFSLFASALVRGRGVAAAIAATVLTTVVASDVSTIAVIASVVAALLRYRSFRHDGWRTVAAVVVAFLVTDAVLYLITPVVGGAAASTDTGRLLLAQLPNAWEWIVLPLANALVSFERLRALVPHHVVLTQVLLACLLAGCHVGFWVSFFRSPTTRSRTFAAILMLFFYGLVGGIIVSRVTVFGSDYLNSPRYILYYQFNLVALVIMLCARAVDAGHMTRARWIAAGLAACYVALQLPLSVHAWRAAPYHRSAYQLFARQIDLMRKDPRNTPERCAPQLPICRMGPEKRSVLISLLYDHRLNLYSRPVMEVHGLPAPDGSLR
ncbi:hypothetical protein LQ772_13475 [Frateuria edaphi]|uniref:hypothetical protein n=1 Tax=Frateuria edaphi TaxID=2898793 RepID=UPI001E3B43E3|nr:hypothetical protein [Frateuria edaphi]UGB44991.1 hypothetical protein LQ772_13475 [Frateuria edaphi]